MIGRKKVRIMTDKEPTAPFTKDTGPGLTGYVPERPAQPAPPAKPAEPTALSPDTGPGGKDYIPPYVPAFGGGKHK